MFKILSRIGSERYHWRLIHSKKTRLLSQMTDVHSDFSSEPEDIMCFRMTVKYDGTKYCGFQRQRGTDQMIASGLFCPKQSSNTSPKRRKKSASFSNTVQDEIESALMHLTGNNIADLRVRSAGRTDAGVHATGTCCYLLSFITKILCLFPRIPLKPKDRLLHLTLMPHY